MKAYKDSIEVLPFCDCMHKPDHEGGRIGDNSATVNWMPGEYEVLDMEQVYCAVSGHRRVCLLQPDLLVSRARVAE